MNNIGFAAVKFLHEGDREVYFQQRSVFEDLAQMVNSTYDIATRTKEANAGVVRQSIQELRYRNLGLIQIIFGNSHR